MRAIQFIRSVPRWLLVRYLSGRSKSLATGPLSCIRLAELDPPPLPAPAWVRVRPVLSGICGSDLSAIACKGSPYFSPFVSTPFVLGHEVAGVIEELGSGAPPQWKAGMRVVIEPALGCEVRGIKPPCEPCARGNYAGCLNILGGSLKGGIQTGYCYSTGGGWSHSFVAHPSQLHKIPDGVSDRAAVLAEPFACSLHGAMLAPRGPEAKLLVLGCGTIGQLAIAGYRAVGGRGTVWAAARYAHQAEMALKLGADEVCRERASAGLYRWVLERAGGSLHQPELGKPVLLGGVQTVLDCVGSSESIDDALRLAAPGGTVLMVGMPGIPQGVDMTALWYKELRLRGTYAYGWEDCPETVAGEERLHLGGGSHLKTGAPDGKVKTLALALHFLKTGKAGPLEELLSRTYPLAQYRAALDDAFQAGPKGVFKVAFEIPAAE